MSPAPLKVDESLSTLTAWLATHSNDKKTAAAALGVKADEIGRWQRAGHVPAHWESKIKGLMAAPPEDELYLKNKVELQAKFPKMPEVLLELCARCGGVSGASKLSGVPAPTCYQIANGANMTALQMQRLKAALPKARALPTEETALRERSKPTPVGELEEHYPKLLAELLRKHDGVVSAAARALGFSSNAWIAKFKDSALEFDEQDQKRVQMALDGRIQPPAAKRSRAWEPDPEYDQGELGLVIINATEDAIEEIFDAGEEMGGKCVFRKKLTDNSWLMIIRMEPTTMSPFKRLVKLVATEVVTP